MSPPRTFAVIPAAGQSRRMGRPKLLLPLGNRSVLRRVLDALRGADLGIILVVVHAGLPEVAVQAEEGGAQVLRLAEETADMRATVEHGLAWLESHCGPRPEDAWLLAPADHPTLSPDVVRALLDARAAHPERSVFVPSYQGHRGHPALIGWGHVPGIRRLPAGQGLNVYLRGQAAQTIYLPVENADVLCDLDTPADYKRLCRRAW
jgi:molybdenum cofactor cytidylyltransferase